MRQVECATRSSGASNVQRAHARVDRLCESSQDEMFDKAGGNKECHCLRPASARPGH